MSINEAELLQLKKEEVKIAKWVRYFITQSEKDNARLDMIKKEIDDLKDKNKILAASVLKLYEKDEKKISKKKV